MDIFDTIFEIFPALVWLFIIIRIVSAVKKPASKGRQTTARTTRSTTGNYKPKNAPKTELGGLKKLASSFGNTDFDDYSKNKKHSDGHAGKTTSGYSRSLSKDHDKMHKASHMQYSHTYDGHEPWDDCMPKEKDPWDKDFYRQG